ncbi:hypothetical protein [Mesorhizobium amorphae]|uniref:hypothetical protein n=1 Tax=Mesorhizobium amorphae TaxID=71433 RepID=UPI001183BC8F|nr:hypothetical protein [Mesorhizobium amorphae]
MSIDGIRAVDKEPLAAFDFLFGMSVVNGQRVGPRPVGAQDVAMQIGSAMPLGAVKAYASVAAMNADVTPAAGTLAYAEGKTYRKTAASGSAGWEVFLDFIPGAQLINAPVTSGTANAVLATSASPVSGVAYKQLIAVGPFTAANTGAMTISINGETARSLVTNTGDPIPANYIRPKMSALVVIDADGKYRLFSYGDASAIQAAAEVARSAAEAARDAALSAVPNVFPASRSLLKQLNTTTVTSAYLKEAGKEGEFIWQSTAPIQTALVGPAINSVSVDASTDVIKTYDAGPPIVGTKHGFRTGHAVLTTTAVNGLALNTIYYVIFVDESSFKLATSFTNAVAGTPFNLTGSSPVTVRKHADPRQGVFVTPDSDLTGASGAWVRAEFDFGNVQASWFDYAGRNNSAEDDLPALQAAVDFLEHIYGIHGAHFGGVVNIPGGVSFWGGTLELTNRVAVRGPNGRAAWIRPKPGFSAQYLVHSQNGSTSQFAVRLENMFLDARGFSLTAVVYAEAWQENCGMRNVLVYMGGVTRWGVHIANGYGGATHTVLEDCEIFSESTHAQRTGLRVSQITSTGAFKLIVRGGLSIAGDQAAQGKNLVNCIEIINDSLIADALHFEYFQNGVSKDGAGVLDVGVITGSENEGGTLVSLASTNTGAWNIREPIVNSSDPTFTFIDYSGRYPSIPRASGNMPYRGPNPDFKLSLTNTISAAAVGGGYNVAFDTRDWDRMNNCASAVFTAPVSGLYEFSGQIGLGLAAGSNSCRAFFTGTGGSAEVFRGNVDGQRTSAGEVVVPLRATRLYLDIGETMRVQILVSGGGITTANILAGLTYFEGHLIGQ